MRHLPSRGDRGRASNLGPPRTPQLRRARNNASLPVRPDQERGPMNAAATDAIRVFVSYAKEDEKWLRDLSSHLGGLRNRGVIAPFDDRQITIGDKWDDTIRQKLEEADFVILLVTKHFLNSAYIHRVELRRALERHNAGECKLLPIIVSTCAWEDEEFAEAQPSPRPGPEGVVPVAKWQDPDEPLTDITKELGARAKQIAAERAAARAEAESATQAARSAATGLDLALYLKRARYRWETVDLTTLAPAGPDEVRPTLARVFVPQDCRRARPPQAVLRDWLIEQGLDPDREEAQRDLLQERWNQEQRLPALDLLARDDARRLVLLGDPGAGKSSLARFVLLELLHPMPAGGGPKWRRALGGYVPFLVELRDMIALDVPGQPCPIPRYLADLGTRLGFGFTAEAVQRQLREGHS